MMVKSTNKQLLLIVSLLPTAIHGFVHQHQQQNHNSLHHRVHAKGPVTPPLQLLQIQSSINTRTQRNSLQRLYASANTNIPPPDNDDDNTENSVSSTNSVGGGGISINLPLIGQNLANQALIGSTIWSGGIGYEILTQKANFGPTGILLGLVGLLPLIGLSRTIEESESYEVSGLNLSTNLAVGRMFGPTSQPLVAFIVSAILAGVTGIVEEVVFRGQLIPVLANQFGGDVLTGTVLSTLLFAVLHTNPTSLLKGGEAFMDNATLLALQTINGGIFALLYLTTGNLAVPIIAHALYDFYVFYKTHLVDVAGQLEYAERETKLPNFSSPTVEQRWIEQKGEDFVNKVKKSFYLMDTNRDGVVSRKELRVELFTYGINLSKMESEQVTQFADVDDNGSIDLDEYIQFVAPTDGSAGEAVKNALYAAA